MTHEADVAAFAAARDRVLETIATAAARAGRERAGITLVAVSKTVPAERLRAAVAAGLTLLGENRVQEAEAKAPDVPGATWHLVGPLQSNKARRALATFTTIETVDTVELARRLDGLAAEVRPGARVPVLLQVNVDADPAKAGFAPDALERSIDELGGLGNLDIRGLMTVGRLVADAEAARPSFAALRTLSERLRRPGSPLGPELSMGMSDDYPVAIEEGATIVRVGRALFGARDRG
ncbi:MAG TPA: YggS family pyridoxal phosphate-dependent enzyme [Candidatus Limnocylindrales bacterium]|nr:YggS family pyridoxal phosphate-dependent enzyme [Candidatus Limnocylindrales bacterium]